MYFSKYSVRIVLALVFGALNLVCASAQQPPKPVGGSVIRGRVVYADTGRPLRRAEIYLLTRDNENATSWRSVTDRNGEFILSNVSAGNYFIVVHAPDIVTPLSPVFPGGESLKLRIALGKIDDGFSEVTVDGRNTAKTEIRASRGGAITGRVMTETDEPIAKAQITLFRIENGKRRAVQSIRGLLDDDNKALETDSRGVYRIAGLATGEYVVRASESNEGGSPDDAAEGSYTDGSLMVAFYPKALRIQDAISMKVQQESETTDVDIRFTERIGHRVSGTVSLQGKPVGGAQINLNRDEPEVNSSAFELPRAQSDDKGQWEIRTVPDGKYTLSVSGVAIGMVRLNDAQNFARIASVRRELIVEGGDVTNLNVEVAEEASVSGAVSVEGGTPLPERLVISLESPSKNDEAAEHTIDFGRYTLVDPKGSFHIAPLPAGSWQFGFTGLGVYYVKSITLKGKDLLRNPIKLNAGQSLAGVSIVLSAELVSLSGRVVAKDDKSKPVGKATVLLFPVEAERRRTSDGPVVAFSDKDGRFTVKAAPGEYFVFVVNRDRKDAAVELPSEASLVKNAFRLQKITLQRGDEKRVVEVVGP
jgi:uncharacterized GH25 family protein